MLGFELSVVRKKAFQLPASGKSGKYCGAVLGCPFAFILEAGAFAGGTVKSNLLPQEGGLVGPSLPSGSLLRRAGSVLG